MSSQLCPCAGCAAAYPGKSLPMCSSLTARKQTRQLSQRATSTIMFHFFVITLPPPASRYRRRSISRPGSALMFGLMPWDFLVIGLAGIQHVHAAAEVGGLARLTHRPVLGRCGRGTDDSRAQPVGHLCRADHRAPMVPQPDQVVVLMPSRLGILPAHPWPRGSSGRPPRTRCSRMSRSAAALVVAHDMKRVA